MTPRYIQPSDPNTFVTSFLDFDYDPTATCPQWFQFLDFLTCGDGDLVETIRQWLGSIFLNIRHEKFLWLHGVGDNGKSVFADVVQGVLGSRAVANLTIDQLAGNHELQGLEGKRLNIAMEFNKVSDAMQAAIKRLVSNEAVGVNPKYKAVYFAKLNVRFMFGSNSVPYVSDRSDGFWRRCLLIPCLAKVQLGQRDVGLAQRLMETEAAAIFNWMLEGAVAVMAAGGHIFEAESIRQAVVTHRRIMDPHREFMRQELTATDNENWIPGVEVLYAAYREWMRVRGHKGALSWPHFKALLKEEFPEIRSSRRRHPTAGRCYGYEGVFWKNAVEQEESYEQQVANRLAKRHATSFAVDVKRDVSEQLRRKRMEKTRRLSESENESADDDYMAQVFKEAGIE